MHPMAIGLRMVCAATTQRCTQLSPELKRFNGWPIACIGLNFKECFYVIQQAIARSVHASELLVDEQGVAGHVWPSTT